ncbi:chromosome partitioning protein ParA [Pusillimonas minor]|uniref:Chromosome partitioning protein ParA n=1 Tax=Pusillimonas minor TaxID=2697024 RepID=A0A842HPZ2_9BURK|nr:chromosome partitioning protein ParA [Pusillimonas minor]MBC2771009.1 chromosome partitioning protein ParA [Pusillimonas minor]
MNNPDKSEKEADLIKRETSVALREKQVQADRQAIEAEKAKLTEREKAIIIAEQKRDAGFADERSALNNELRDKRNQLDAEISNIRAKKLLELDDEVAKLKSTRLDEISNAENMERERIRAEIVKERNAWATQQNDDRKKLNAERTELEKQKGALSALQSEVEGRKVELESAERMIERKEQRLGQQWQRRNEQLQDEVEEQIRERRKSLEATEANFRAENARLREALNIQTGLVSAFEQLKQQLGGKDPAEILRALNSQTDELKRLREELATRPTEEMRERYQALESDARNQRARADELERQIISNEAAIAEIGDLRRQNSVLNAENKSLAQRASIFEGAANEAQAELNRLRAAYERPAEVEARYKEIEMPHISVDKAKQPVQHEIDEITWLTGIGNACDTYGLHFNPRILKAFHTALKTAEWSPLTVLAGVSGTGKSELPRLYSHFGGIYFEPLSVQPNWDSQESMLGFFNSIDNKFDAQPVLRLLAQSQKPWSNDYPGLQDAVCLVLLDEMNLAHPELYFAEFLSKLELRRGRKGSDVPFIPVKIGAGMKPYELSLGRNVLWTGTMNQDETTKSLSDKVLDRSIIINFPRPTELKRRLKLTPLDERNRGPALHKASWQSWLVQGSIFPEEVVKPFKVFIENMNAALAISGRALGHRIWQSIEYYMANYPDVRAALAEKDELSTHKAMHIAFEDQLVQKVMPKLRGIDTRGKSKTECLDKIRGQIVAGINGNSFNLAEDFDLACELGYGQFIWQSANYLNVSVTDDNASPIATQTDNDGEDPPPLFQKDETDSAKRRKAWNAKKAEHRDELRRKLEENAKAGRILDQQ